MGKWSMRDFAYHGPMPWEDEAECGPVVMGLDYAQCNVRVVPIPGQEVSGVAIQMRAEAEAQARQSFNETLHFAAQQLEQATGLRPFAPTNLFSHRLGQEAKNARARTAMQVLEQQQRDLMRAIYGGDQWPQSVRDAHAIAPRKRNLRVEHFKTRNIRQHDSSISWSRASTPVTSSGDIRIKWMMRVKFASGLILLHPVEMGHLTPRGVIAERLRIERRYLWASVHRLGHERRQLRNDNHTDKFNLGDIKRLRAALDNPFPRGLLNRLKPLKDSIY